MEEKIVESKPNIVIDNGTDCCKAGFSAEEGPRTVFPSYVGYPKYFSDIIGRDKTEYFVGDDAEAKRCVLDLTCPIKRGEIINFEDMEKIWGHVFNNELRENPNEYNVMLTEVPLNPKENREKMTQIMFETFNVPGLYISLQPSLSLYASGKLTGIVLELGEGINSFCPIFDGFSLPHALNCFDFSGIDLTEYMMKLLKGVESEFIAKSIKEKTCYVALDFEEELKYVEPFDYCLPDGTHVKVNDERIKCPEALFKPIMGNRKGKGIEQLCYDSIQKCDIDTRQDLYKSIILSGGTSLFIGLKERFIKEIKKLVPESMKEKVEVTNLLEGRLAAWIGGSILSSISTFESMWITRNEYKESGANIVHRKCF